MTTEQRLDRLERIAKLFVRAGIRFRRNLRALDEKIAILVDAQIRNEDLSFEIRRDIQAMTAAQARNDERFARSDERFAKADERFAKSDERFAKFEERFAKADERFAKSDERFAKSDERFAKFEQRFAKADERFAKFEQQTDQTLQALMMLMQERRNGNP